MKLPLSEPAPTRSRLKPQWFPIPFRLGGLLALALFAAPGLARAQDANDQYLSIYNVVRRADELSTNGSPPEKALEKYRDAQGYLLTFKSLYPKWHPDVVTLRMQYVATKINELSVSNAASASPSASAAPELHVKLLDAGSEPRSVLRLHPQAGDKQTLVMTMRIALQTLVAGTPAPEVKLPPMKMTMEETVKDVSADGNITYQTVVSDAGVEEEAGVTPIVAAAMKGSLEKLKGLTGTGTMSNRGLYKGLDMKVPEGADAQVRQTLDQMKESLSNISTPLPEEAVGTGARWEVKMPIKSQGMTIDQTLDYQVSSIEGDHLSLTNALTQTAARQKIQNPALGGAKAQLTKMAGAGTGSLTLDIAHLMPLSAELNFHADMDMSIETPGQKQDMEMKMDMDMLLQQQQ